MKEGWEKKKLGEVAEIEYGTRVVQKKDGGTLYPVYGGGGATFRMDTYNREDRMVIARFAMSPQCTRYVNGKFFLNDSGLTVSPNNKELKQDYLDRALFSLNNKIYSLGKGAAQKNLDMKAFKEMLIPVPPLSVQESIVSELDMLSGIISKHKALQEEYDRLEQSIFYDMFGDPVTNEKGWEVKKLEEVASIGTGSTPDRKNESYYNGNIPWVKSTEVCNEEIFKTQEYISEEALTHSNCTIYPKDCILMAMYGQGKTRGQVGILRIEACTNQAVAAIIHDKTINTTFLFEQLKHKYHDIRAMANGCNQSNLNLSIVKSIKIIVPPLSLQQSFADKISAIEQMKAKNKAAQEEAEMLFNERMAYYF